MTAENLHEPPAWRKYLVTTADRRTIVLATSETAARAVITGEGRQVERVQPLVSR